MKTKRFVSTLLALLMVCSLPVSAFAMGNNPAGTTVTEIRTGEVMNINDGTVTTNNGTVTTNNGTVTDNYYLVQSNNGTVSNNGTEENNDYASVSKNYGTITTNEGNVDFNGTETNHDKAIVETNNSFVNYNYGVVSTNKNFVDNNNGTVTNNYDEIFENNEGAEVTDNKAGAVVHKNYGTVTTNKGTVERNLGGTVTTNNGTVNCNDDGGTVETNKGTVNNNFSQGTVSTNEGTVTENLGTVTTNEITGTVTNKNNGTVGTNYGTVNEADGTTHYGVQVDNEGDVSLAQKENGETWDLAQLFTKAGYVLTGFIQAYQTGENGLTQASTTVEGTSYTADCPNVLTLIWQAIVNPGSGEIAAAASDGTGSFGHGSVISINGYKFLLVAVVEDVYCLASVDSFEDEALSDLPALLASLLTEEQLTHVTGDPELLDEELTARFFAGQGSHIVFPCDSGLIFS